jgi:hypothetical protein
MRFRKRDERTPWLGRNEEEQGGHDPIDIRVVRLEEIPGQSGPKKLQASPANLSQQRR